MLQKTVAKTIDPEPHQPPRFAATAWHAAHRRTDKARQRGDGERTRVPKGRLIRVPIGQDEAQTPPYRNTALTALIRAIQKIKPPSILHIFGTIPTRQNEVNHLAKDK